MCYCVEVSLLARLSVCLTRSLTPRLMNQLRDVLLDVGPSCRLVTLGTTQPQLSSAQLLDYNPPPHTPPPDKTHWSLSLSLAHATFKSICSIFTKYSNIKTEFQWVFTNFWVELQGLNNGFSCKYVGPKCLIGAKLVKISSVVCTLRLGRHTSVERLVIEYFFELNDPKTVWTFLQKTQIHNIVRFFFNNDSFPSIK